MISPETAHQRIAQLSQLEEDWDSYGARPMTPAAIAKAHELVDKRPHLLQTIYPIPDGGFMLVWSFFPSEVEVEITPDGKYASTVAQVVIVEKEDISEEEVLSIIDRACEYSKDRREPNHIPWDF
jgi:hypothetical protein